MLFRSLFFNVGMRLFCESNEDCFVALYLSGMRPMKKAHRQVVDELLKKCPQNAKNRLQLQMKRYIFEEGETPSAARCLKQLARNIREEFIMNH